MVSEAVFLPATCETCLERLTPALVWPDLAITPGQGFCLALHRPRISLCNLPGVGIVVQWTEAARECQ